MRKYLPVVVAMVIMAAAIALYAFREVSPVEDNIIQTSSGDKVEVFYFHLTRRCVTCQAVENVAREAVGELYADEVKSGLVVFRSLNLEDKANEPVAERVKATGQCLLVVSGDARIDLTSDGFMYARNNPEKLRDGLKKAIDPLLKAGR